jgi:hypothetical protein
VLKGREAEGRGDRNVEGAGGRAKRWAGSRVGARFETRQIAAVGARVAQTQPKHGPSTSERYRERKRAQKEAKAWTGRNR